MVAVVVGALAAVAGLGAVVSYGDHLISLGEIGAGGGPQAGSLSYVGGNALLVVAEVGAVLLFTLLSVAALALHGRVAGAAIAITAALGKALWLVASVSTHWKPGWYFILDPKGTHSEARILFFASVGQALAMAIAAVVAARAARSATARPD